VPEIAPAARRARLAGARSQDFELIVVGGGIHGVMLAYEAGLRGVRALLVERADFGAATSFNSLRIVHGGLRYLQSTDLPRFFESVAERRWLLREFPDLVFPLACLMPLYGDGMRRPGVLRIALAVNDLLSSGRNRGVPPANGLPGGEVLSPERVAGIFPEVRREGLQGGAVWHDACVPDSQLLIARLLQRAERLGASALNYVEATALRESAGQVSGLVARDTVSGETLEFTAPRVVNAAGPWCEDVARRLGADKPGLMHRSIAWNVLFDRPALADHALALVPPRPGAPTYFATPWKGRLLVGTVHAPWTSSVESPAPGEAGIDAFIEDLNASVPGLGLKRDSITRVFSGILPAKQADGAELTVREKFVDHGQDGGPRGLYSIVGIKLTTARAVADKTLRRVFPGKRRNAAADDTAETAEAPLADALPQILQTGGDSGRRRESLEALLARNAVVHLDDLLFRRTDSWCEPDRAIELARAVATVLGWSDAERRDEMDRLSALLGRERARRSGTAIAANG